MATELSLETLNSIPDGELTAFIWDFYLEYFSGNPGRKMPRGFRIAWLTIVFREEMDNGGIHQYITNRRCVANADEKEIARRSTAALAEVKECLDALRLIGATQSAELLNEGLSVYEKHGWPYEPADRWLNFPEEADAICESIDLRWSNHDGPDSSYARDWRCGERYLREHVEDCVVEW